MVIEEGSSELVIQPGVRMQVERSRCSHRRRARQHHEAGDQRQERAQQPVRQLAAAVPTADAAHALHAVRGLRQDLHHAAGQEGRAESHHLLQDPARL